MRLRACSPPSPWLSFRIVECVCCRICRSAENVLRPATSRCFVNDNSEKKEFPVIRHRDIIYNGLFGSVLTTILLNPHTHMMQAVFIWLCLEVRCSAYSKTPRISNVFIYYMDEELLWLHFHRSDLKRSKSIRFNPTRCCTLFIRVLATYVYSAL